MSDGLYLLNVLNTLKMLPEMCCIFCATANPTEIVLAETEQGRGILGVADGFSPKGVEDEGEIKRALVEDGIPFTSFGVDDVRAEYDRLRSAGVHFTQPPVAMGPVTTAVNEHYRKADEVLRVDRTGRWR